MNDYLKNFLNWLPALISWIGVLCTYKSYRLSARAIQLSEKQDERRQPILNLYLEKSYRLRTNGDFFYIFLISVSNQSDSDNSIVRIDLKIKYNTVSNLPTAVDIPLVSQHINIPEENYHSPLDIPTKINAHHTIAGRASFRISADMLKGCSVNSYAIVVEDSHCQQTSIETSLVKEIVNEVKIEKD